jgi:hypothetical protein
MWSLKRWKGKERCTLEVCYQTIGESEKCSFCTNLMS